MMNNLEGELIVRSEVQIGLPAERFITATTSIARVLILCQIALVKMKCSIFFSKSPGGTCRVPFRASDLASKGLGVERCAWGR